MEDLVGAAPDVEGAGAESFWDAGLSSRMSYELVVFIVHCLGVSMRVAYGINDGAGNVHQSAEGEPRPSDLAFGLIETVEADGLQ